MDKYRRNGDRVSESAPVYSGRPRRCFRKRCPSYGHPAAGAGA
jgi:hypothetical protein